jgi:hypothetical protein
MTTGQSWILMRVVKRLTALESALRVMLKRSFTEGEPAGSMMAIGGLATGPSKDSDRRHRPFGGTGTG